MSPKAFWVLRVLLALVVAAAVLDLLYPADLRSRSRAQSVVDAHGEPLRHFADAQGIWRYSVTRSQVSQRYIDALLAYEDRWFFHHFGINPLAILRAVAQWISHGKVVSGASTLTMQVARLRYPNAHGASGKWLQMARALQLEWHYDKREILEYYLNHAPFGGAIEGVEAASRYYFGHASAEMTWAQAALLAGLPQAPSYLRPDRYPNRARAQRNKVLDRLAVRGLLSSAEVQEAKLEQIQAPPTVLPMAAPLLSRRLKERYPDEAVIRTFIDAQTQRALDTLLRRYKGSLPYGASAAVLVMEHGSGRVIAYAGSVDFLDNERFAHVDMVRAYRSPGSTLKPFIYAMAMDEGIVHSESLLMDVPLRFGDYKPFNFNRTFSGPVSLSTALSQSLNVPAVQVLEQIGPGAFYAKMQNGGAKMRLQDAAVPNLSMALGGASTSLEHLVTLYSALANGGETIVPRLSEGDPQIRRTLITPQSAWIVRTILESAYQQKRRGNVLAVKTGTSSGNRDTWALGIGRYHTVGVWVGHPDNADMSGHMGITTAVPLLEEVARLLPKGVQTPHGMPEGVEAKTICWPSGGEDDGLCDVRRKAWVIHGNTPTTLMATRAQMPLRPKPYAALLLSSESNLSVTLGCVEETIELKVPVWPAPLQSKIPQKWRNEYRIPKLDPRCNPNSRSVERTSVRISGIDDASRIRIHPITGKSPQIEIKAVGGEPQWYWFLNDVMLESHSSYLTLTPEQPGSYELRVSDQAGQSDTVHFTLERDEIERR